MTEFVIYRGLPGSGKTTHARTWVAADPVRRARVNRDDLRAMLHGGYVDSEVERAGPATARDVLIARLLERGISVACDDTNLPQRLVRELARIGRRAGAEIRIVDLTDVPVDECVRRDLERGMQCPEELVKGECGYVGEEVVRGMHARYLAGKTHPLPFPEDVEDDASVYTYEPDDLLPEAWLVDLDGTLALMAGRDPFDWHRVGEDSPNDPVHCLVEGLARMMGPQRGCIIVLSGRDEVCRDETVKWLVRHHVPCDFLYMRPAGDTRKDSIVKLELFREFVAPRFAVRGVLDDRQQVVDMWRSIGLFCAQVAPGDF